MLSATDISVTAQKKSVLFKKHALFLSLLVISEGESFVGVDDFGVKVLVRHDE